MELPWDWSDVISSTRNGRTEFSEHDLVIQKINDNTIKLGGIKFRIDSVVFENASAEEIIEGYEEMKSFCEVDRVVELLVAYMIVKVNRHLNIQAFEPNVIDFARFVFGIIGLKTLRPLDIEGKRLTQDYAKSCYTG